MHARYAHVVAVKVQVRTAAREGHPVGKYRQAAHEAWPLFLGIAAEGAAQPAPMGMCGMLRVGVDATARGMKPPILTVAPSIPTAIVSTVWPTSASFALSASPVCSAVGGGG